MLEFLRRFRTYKIISLALVITCIYFFFILPLDFFQVAGLGMEDLFVKYRYFTHPPALDISKFVLISIDGESVLKLGERWPLKREVYAEFIRKLSSYKPKLIALDFIFAGKETLGGDFLLAESLKTAGNAILASYVNQKGQLIDSKKDIRQAALATGVASKMWDRDFTVRRIRPFYQTLEGAAKGKWSWELEIFANDKKIDLNNALVEKNQISLVEENSPILDVPILADGSSYINYRFRLEDMESVPFWQIMDGSAEGEKIRDKITLVGTTSAALLDFYPTPLGVMPGITINFNYLINLYKDDFCHVAPPWINFFVLFIGVFVALLAGIRLELHKGFLLIIGWVFAFFGLSWFLVLRSFLWDFFSPVIAALFLYLIISLVRYAYLFIENLNLRRRVIEDALTGLFTRGFMKARLEAEISKIGRFRKTHQGDAYREIAVLMVDVDHFKSINDKFGHQVGDEALKVTAKILKDCTRSHDIAARYGGEEFCALLLDVSEEDALIIAERIRSEVEAGDMSSLADGLGTITVSVGCAMVLKNNLDSYHKAIKSADVALYRAKSSGRNQVCRFDPSIDHI